MEIFRAARKRAFCRGIVADLCASHPSLAKRHTTEAMTEFALIAFERAPFYDLLLPEDIARFIHFTLCHGIDFEQRDEMRWAVKILGNPRISSDVKFLKIAEGPPAAAH